jgi:murein DD-endopeptidase MepM/ murein hydrolase activator NlpD
MLTPASLAELRFYDLKNPTQELTNPAISQGGALLLKVTPGSNLWWNGEPVFVADNGFALVALHRDSTTANLKVQQPGEKASIYSLPVTRRDYQIERINGLPPSKVTAPPDPDIQQRIRNEAAEIQAARKRLDDRQDFLDGFIWPVKGRISGRYGSQRILNGEPKTPHYGVDVAVPTGTEVVAPAAGVVIYANFDMYYSGGTLVIDHGHGLSSAFLHLSDLLVPVGTRVKQGQPVAKVGATGRATGPHLDWRMNWGSKVRVDPQLLVESMTK